MDIRIQRKIYNTIKARNVIGELFIDGQWFCYTLEDEIRPDGVKVKEVTAIPAGKYFIKVTYSPKFGRPLPLIYNTGDFTIDMAGKQFSGVRFHGGNDEEDSAGCPLVGFETNGVKIWNSASQELTEQIQAAGGEATLMIEDRPLTGRGLTKQLI